MFNTLSSLLLLLSSKTLYSAISISGNESFWNELSPGTLLVFSFYTLGVSHANIAKELGITIRASED
ncbi:hypothetical protein FHC88_23225, partial [Salmonella enterica]|nr:hypothetical protein [Salmonella enterica]